MTNTNPGAVPQQPTQMVTYSKKKTNHVLHLLLSIVTVGVWIPVWIVIAVVNSMRKEKSVTRPA